jgi:signal peptidase I
MQVFRKVKDWYYRPNKSTIAQYIETFIIILPIAFVIRTFLYGFYQVPTGSMEVTMLVGDRFFADKFSVLFYPPKHGDIITFNAPDYDYSDNRYMRLFQRYVWGPSNWTKRVVGIPGDHVKGVIEDGKPVIYLNGQMLEENHVNKHPLVAVFKQGTFPPWSFKSWDKDYSYEDQPFYRLDEMGVRTAARILSHYGEESIRYPYTPVVNGHGNVVDEYDVHLGPDEYWVLGDNRRASNDSRFWGPLKKEHIHGKIIWRLFSIEGNDSWLIIDLLKNPIDFFKRIRWSRFFQRVR